MLEFWQEGGTTGCTTGCAIAATLLKAGSSSGWLRNSRYEVLAGRSHPAGGLFPVCCRAFFDQRHQPAPDPVRRVIPRNALHSQQPVIDPGVSVPECPPVIGVDLQGGPGRKRNRMSAAENFGAGQKPVTLQQTVSGFQASCAGSCFLAATSSAEGLETPRYAGMSRTGRKPVESHDFPQVRVIPGQVLVDHRPASDAAPEPGITAMVDFSKVSA